jgi:hypothetical protein
MTTRCGPLLGRPADSSSRRTSISRTRGGTRPGRITGSCRSDCRRVSAEDELLEELNPSDFSLADVSAGPHDGVEPKTTWGLRSEALRWPGAGSCRFVAMCMRGWALSHWRAHSGTSRAGATTMRRLGFPRLVTGAAECLEGQLSQTSRTKPVRAVARERTAGSTSPSSKALSGKGPDRR